MGVRGHSGRSRCLWFPLLVIARFWFWFGEGVIGGGGGGGISGGGGRGNSSFLICSIWFVLEFLYRSICHDNSSLKENINCHNCLNY